MQDDLTDAAAWAVAQGYADPKRIAFLRRRYQVAGEHATHPIDVIMPAEGGGRTFTRARWVLVPYWWSRPLKAFMYRDAFAKRRSARRD